MTLLDARPGTEVIVQDIEGGWGLSRRLAEMGLYRGVRLRVLSGGPLRGPVYVEVVGVGNRFSLGRGAADRVLVKVVAEGSSPSL